MNMQTFLPYKSTSKSAQCLDKKRVFKQAVECKQILCTIHAKNLPCDWMETKSWKSQKWKNHPAVKEWIPYENFLKDFYNECLSRSLSLNIKTHLPFLKINHIEKPWFIGNEIYHDSIKSQLLKKNFDFYSKKFTEEEIKKSKKYNFYNWPLNETKTFRIIEK